MPRMPLHTSSFDKNLASFKENLLASIETATGEEREALERKLAQLENASNMISSLRTNTAGA